MPYDAPGPEAENRIREASQHLGPRALQLLADIAERLAKGAKQYGDFDDKPRDWVQETLEETADGLVYASMKLLEGREAKAADEARNRAARRLSDDAPGWGGQKRHGMVHDYGQNREPLGPDFYKHYGPPTERDGVWAECKPSGLGAISQMLANAPRANPTWPVNTPGEDWEKTRDGCG